MSHPLLNRTLLPLLAAAVCAGLVAPSAHADDRRGPRGPVRGYSFDRRFEHDRYYPRPGFAVPALPRGYYDVPWRGSSYYFHGGVWYRPNGPRYVVVQPPLGIGAPALPFGYTTVWINGAPYYYADGTYYLWAADRREYVVTSPPPNADSGTTAAPANEEVFAYPRNGQSEAQQSTDRYECHDWARGQTGFDPTMPLGGVDASQAAGKRAEYLRAQRACLEGRGYTAR
jgi:hypothetical protein